MNVAGKEDHDINVSQLKGYHAQMSDLAMKLKR